MKSSAPLFRISAPVALVLSLGFTACSGTAPSAMTPAAPAVCSSTGLFVAEVFADASHQQPQCQFNPDNAAAAYVYLANVAPSDYYVMYVETTGANPGCVYVSPQSKPALTCNPQRSNGVQAPGGDLSLTWELNSSLPGGAYTVSVYDKTTGTLLTTVQVTLKRGS